MDKVSAPPKKNGHQGEGGGPVPHVIDREKVLVLAGIQCTYDEIAAVMGIKKRQFIDRINAEPDLKATIEDGWANGRASIRRQQYKLLNEGNATMGIWLGKQYLGQRDQWSGELTGKDGKPLGSDLSILRVTLLDSLAELPPETRAQIAQKLLAADGNTE